MAAHIQIYTEINSQTDELENKKSRRTTRLNLMANNSNRQMIKLQDETEKISNCFKKKGEGGIRKEKRASAE